MAYMVLKYIASAIVNTHRTFPLHLFQPQFSLVLLPKQAVSGTALSMTKEGSEFVWKYHIPSVKNPL
jgi:hypothetical protein